MESKLKHLEMVQGVIARMASNSFLLKGWAVTLVVGLLAFANIQGRDNLYSLLAIIPLIFFWTIDSYYVRQERLFRQLYDMVRKKKTEDIDFSMNTKGLKENFFKVLLCSVLTIFYVPMVLLVFFIIFVLPCIFSQ